MDQRKSTEQQTNGLGAREITHQFGNYSGWCPRPQTRQNHQTMAGPTQCHARGLPRHGTLPLHLRRKCKTRSQLSWICGRKNYARKNIVALRTRIFSSVVAFSPRCFIHASQNVLLLPLFLPNHRAVLPASPSDNFPAGSIFPRTKFFTPKLMQVSGVGNFFPPFLLQVSGVENFFPHLMYQVFGVGKNSLILCIKFLGWKFFSLIWCSNL